MTQECMSSFMERAKKEVQIKAKKAKKKIVKRAIELAKYNTPVYYINGGLLKSTIREFEINDLTSLITWGSARTRRKMKDGSTVGYEIFVAYGTKYQVAQLYHIVTARMLVKEFPGLRLGSGITPSVTTSSKNITLPRKYF